MLTKLLDKIEKRPPGLGASQILRETPARAARGRQKQQGLGFLVRGSEALRVPPKGQSHSSNMSRRARLSRPRYCHSGRSLVRTAIPRFWESN